MLIVAELAPVAPAVDCGLSAIAKEQYVEFAESPSSASVAGFVATASADHATPQEPVVRQAYPAIIQAPLVTAVTDVVPVLLALELYLALAATSIDVELSTPIYAID